MPPSPVPPTPTASCQLSLPTTTGRTLYVNSATGNDAVSYLQNSEATPWRTIGRAAWGSANRSTPNQAEAARAGDTVLIASGTYSSNERAADLHRYTIRPIMERLIITSTLCVRGLAHSLRQMPTAR
jgi:hypothetical protein